jgi:hypothetical protein
MGYDRRVGDSNIPRPDINRKGIDEEDAGVIRDLVNVSERVASLRKMLTNEQYAEDSLDGRVSEGAVEPKKFVKSVEIQLRKVTNSQNEKPESDDSGHGRVRKRRNTI